MVNVIISSDPRYHINRASIQTAVLNILKEQNVRGKSEIEVNIVGDRKMHELNKTYRGINATTDVLSFALQDPLPQNLRLITKFNPGEDKDLDLVIEEVENKGLGGGLRGFVAAPDGWLRLGSIVVSYQEAVEDAVLDGISVEEEIIFLVEHGTRHLLGIHHD